MDNRRVFIGMLLAMALVLMWQPAFLWLEQKLGYTRPRPPVATTTQPASTQESPVPAPAPFVAATAPTVAAAPASGLRATPATQPVAVRIGSDKSQNTPYKMEIALQPKGAGVEGVVLNEFTFKARSVEPYRFQTPYPKVEETSRSLATRAVIIDGATIDLTGVDWTLDGSTPESATYSVTIIGDSGPVARIQKTYRLASSSDASAGYEVAVGHTITNLVDRPLNASLVFNGPTLPPREQERGGERQVLAGYAVKGAHVELFYDAIEGFSKDKTSKEYTKDKQGNPLLWAGSSSTYFNALVRPLPLDESKTPPNYLEKVTASAVNPDAAAEEHQILMTFNTTGFAIAPGQSVTIPVRAYFGPRQRGVLNSLYYSTYPIGYDHTLVLTSGICAVCTFQWLINLLVWMLGIFHTILFKDWGLAIIGLVVLVRTLLHPVTKRSQISMSKMSKMGPEMERLKKKHGDNKDELNKAMMQFYKEQGATPILGCLPMFLQMPIWIALYTALQTTFELRQAPFLHFFNIPFTWIDDLSQPDHLMRWDPVPLFFGWTISGLNILPFLLGIVFWVQMKMQPKPAAMTPEQEQQQKMMQWMTLLFPLMLYSGPSGLNLYILTSTGIGIVESKIIRDHIKEREEAEKAGRVIVDGGKKLKKNPGGNLAIAKPADQPKGRFMTWLAKIQEQAEQVRREQDKRK